MTDKDRYIAQPNYVERIYLAIESNNPNAPEDLDEVSVQALANYAEANGLIEDEIVDQILDPSSESCLAYFLYDLLKWTKANNV